jgi:thioredoxin-like negative regulator of GroEL
MQTEFSTEPPPRRPVALDSEADLDRFVDAHDRVLVDFYTEGCSLCAAIEPVVGNVARAHDDLAVATINPRDDPPLIEQFGITSVPTLVLFEGGAEVGRLAEGFQGGDAIDAFLSDPADANVDTDA